MVYTIQHIAYTLYRHYIAEVYTTHYGIVVDPAYTIHITDWYGG